MNVESQFAYAGSILNSYNDINKNPLMQKAMETFPIYNINTNNVNQNTVYNTAAAAPAQYPMNQFGLQLLELLQNLNNKSTVQQTAITEVPVTEEVVVANTEVPAVKSVEIADTKQFLQQTVPAVANTSVNTENQVATEAKQESTQTNNTEYQHHNHASTNNNGHKLHNNNHASTNNNGHKQRNHG